VKQTRLSS